MLVCLYTYYVLKIFRFIDSNKCIGIHIITFPKSLFLHILISIGWANLTKGKQAFLNFNIFGYFKPINTVYAFLLGYIT